MKLSAPWALLDTGDGWVIRGRCLPSAAMIAHPRSRADLQINGRNAAVAVSRVAPQSWRRTVVWIGADGNLERRAAGLDREGACVACDRKVVEVGITDDGTILLGHPTLLF